MQGWIYLYLGVFFGALSLPLAKWANGFEKLNYGIGAVALYAMATVCWVLAMRHLTLSTAWLIWLGMDAVVMLMVSHFLFHESFDAGKLVCMALILSGCIGLNVMEMRKG